jgi:hypothetical protein
LLLSANPILSITQYLTSFQSKQTFLKTWVSLKTDSPTVNSSLQDKTLAKVDFPFPVIPTTNKFLISLFSALNIRGLKLVNSTCGSTSILTSFKQLLISKLVSWLFLQQTSTS